MATRRGWMQWGGLIALAGLGVPFAAAAERDDAAVYAAFLNASARQADQGERAMPLATLVLHPVSLVPGRGDRTAQEAVDTLKGLPGASPQTGQDLLRGLARPESVILPLTLIDARVRVIQPLARELDAIFTKHHPWEAFYERFPARSSLAKLSPVGYNHTFDEAAFVLSVQCGELCGYGTLARLHKTANGWQVVDQKLMWVN